jgi:hypothetical protein
MPGSAAAQTEASKSLDEVNKELSNRSQKNARKYEKMIRVILERLSRVSKP